MLRYVLQPRPVQHERIDPAVVVVVEQRDAGAIGFDDEAFAVDAAVGGRLAQPRPVGDVDERHGPLLIADCRLLIAD
ncbi:MAG: hypothetical protein DMG00_25630 [Acidobacteria bacterium]|nr:MAG: hypothetical protein DMG00_25630 [Acidobacteriota bacterium]